MAPEGPGGEETAQEEEERRRPRPEEKPLHGLGEAKENPRAGARVQRREGLGRRWLQRGLERWASREAEGYEKGWCVATGGSAGPGLGTGLLQRRGTWSSRHKFQEGFEQKSHVLGARPHDCTWQERREAAREAVWGWSWGLGCGEQVYFSGLTQVGSAVLH